MKKSVICISGSPAFIRRFGRWLKNRYNVQFPSKEVRFGKLGLVVTWWEIAYHDDGVFGSSERKLESIARTAENEHLRHIHKKCESCISWEIYSE